MIEQLLSNLKYDPPGPSGEGPPGVEFLGEVPTVGFINGEELASAIGLGTGITQHTTEPWLHFTLDGKTLYVAKKPYQYRISWSQINGRGAVSGTRTVVINGLEYKVRLLKTVATGDRYTGWDTGYDPEGAYKSEWNRLMYSVHSGTGNPSPVSGEGINFGSLAQYTDTDLGIRGKGSYSWCQETHSGDSSAGIVRGSIGVSSLSWVRVSYVSSDFDWRPVLELVQ